MSYRNALDRLAALNVTAVPHRFGITDLPTQLQRARLPCLLVMPLNTQPRSGDGLSAAAFPNGSGHVTVTATHLLLVMAVASPTPLTVHLPALVDLTDAVLSALVANPTLDGALVEPAQVRVEPGMFEWGGTAYYGCAFRHEWLLRL